MEKRYKSSKWEKFYTNTRSHQKEFGKNVADGLHELLDLIDAATSAYDIKVMPYCSIIFSDILSSTKLIIPAGIVAITRYQNIFPFLFAINSQYHLL